MREVLFVTPGFPASEDDDQCLPFIQAYVHRLAELHGAQHVRVLATQYPFQRGTYRWHGVEVKACGGANRRWMKPIIWLQALREGAGWLRARPAEVVHSFWLGECAWIASRLARAQGTRHVLTLLVQDARDERNWWRAVKGKGARVVALSDRHGEEFARMSGQRPEAIVPFGIDTRVASTAAQRDIDILFAGSLIPVKRPELFIEVVQRVLAKRNVRVVICGSRIPAGNRYVDDLVVGSGLSGVVEVTGDLPRAQVLERMARSRVLVHTSRYESQGYVFNEALMQGMRIVSFPVGIAQPGEHWSVVEGMDDVERMAEQVLLALEQPLDAGVEAPHRVEDTVRAYDRLYDR